MAAKAAKSALVDTSLAIEMDRFKACIVSTSPMCMHAFSWKSIVQLTQPPPKANAAERAMIPKHNPLEEYQGCFYLNRVRNDTPAAFHLPSNAFHKGLCQAALRIPGAKKAEISNLVTIVSRHIDLYGIPKLHFAMVREGMAKTPNVRFRPLFARWACEIEVQYAVNPLTRKHVNNLISGSGFFGGMGDGRQGKTPYEGWGFYRQCSPDDPEYVDIVRNEGKAPQMEAYNNPEPWNEDTERLIDWFNHEVGERFQRTEDLDVVQEAAE